MHCRSCHFIAIAAVLSLLVTVFSQAAPPAITGLTGQTSFTSQDQEKITDYAGFWCDALARSKPEEVSRIRRKLLAPVHLSSTPFKMLYSNTLIPCLRDIVDQDSAHRAINAIIVLQMLGTDKALDTVTDHCNKLDEPKMHIRLRAVVACGVLMNAESVSPNKISNSIRALKSAIEAEDDGLVIRRQLEALHSVQNDQAPGAREKLAEALGVLAERLNDQNLPPTDQLQAIESILPDLLRTYITLSSSERVSLGKVLAEPFVQILQLPFDQWDQAQKNTRLKILYESIIQPTEQILKRIDQAVRPRGSAPNTQLKEAWTGGTKDRYDRDLKQWSNLVTQRDYRP